MNNVPGMTFGFDGPSVTGWWVNPKTGDKFKAIDTFFEDNRLLIKTADGRLLDYNRIQDYVQTDKPDSIQVNKQQNKPKPKQESIPIEVLNEIEKPEDMQNEAIDLLIPEDNIYSRPQEPARLGNMYNQPAVQEPVGDAAIVNRALQSKTTPNITGNVTWTDFPQREIEMLVDVMSVPKEAIIDYYTSQISLETIRDMVKVIISEFIEKKLSYASVPTTIDDVVKEQPKLADENPKTTKKPTVAKKTTTKKK